MKTEAPILPSLSHLLLGGLLLSFPTLPAPAEGVETWHWRNPVPTGNQLYGVTYGNGLFVAVGALETTQTSPDGIHWTLRHSGSVPLRAVAYGNGRYVAVGDSGPVLSSPDGTNWTSAFTTPSNWSAVSYGNGVFVAVGSDGFPWMSTNGLAWTNRGNFISSGLRGITYGNGRFVTVGDSGTVYASTNLTNWTAVFGAGPLAAITYGNNTFVAVGSAGATIRSSDGVEWSIHNSGAPSALTGVAWGNGSFVAVDGSGAILTSSDGTTWTNVGFPQNTGYLTAVGFGSGLFVAVGDPVLTATQPGGRGNWTNRTQLTTQPLYGAGFGAGTFVAAGGGGATLRSSGGTNWALDGLFGTDLYSVSYGAGKFVAVGNAGVILTSPDAIAWTTNSANATSQLYAVTFAAGRFVAVGAEVDSFTAILSTPIVLTSVDGVSWSKDYPNISAPLVSIAYGNGLFVGVANNIDDPSNDSVATSPDGLTWACHAVGTNVSLNGIAFGNGLFVIVGSLASSAAVAVSSDGANWFVEQGSELAIAYAIAYQNGLFAAVGPNGIATSPNGLDWTNRFSPGVPLFGVAAGNGSFVAVGNNGAILQSDPVTSTGSGPPVILTQPQSQATPVGGAVGFGVSATGASPLQYQWQKNGALLAGATNNVLILTDIQPSDAGVYGVVVSNSTGQTNSVPAGLIVSGADPLDYWTFRNLPSGGGPDSVLNVVAYGSGTFVAMGNNGLTLTSSNGVIWSRHPLSTGFNASALAFGNGIFVALGNGDLGCANVFVSPDGIRWNSPSGLSSCLGPVKALAFGDGKFVAVGSGLILVSTNGLSWLPSVDEVGLGLSVDFDLGSITYGDGLFVAVGTSPSSANNVILTSPDGWGWTFGDYGYDPTFGPFGTFHHVAYGNGRFVVTGLNGYNLVSADGVFWDAEPLPSASLSTLDDITYGDGQFVATPDMSFGPPFTVLTSADGIAWVPHQINAPLGVSGSIQDIVYGQNAFVAVGTGGLIFQSDPLSALAPSIVQQPRSRTVPIGGTAVLAMLATGSSPLSYEWYQNGLLLCASNGPSLSFQNVQLGQTGDYFVIASNPYGSVTSVVARLIVEPDQPILSLRFDTAARLTIWGCIGCTCRIESQDAFDPHSLAWRPLATFPLPATPCMWTDPESPFFPTRFYRVVRTDTP